MFLLLLPLDILELCSILLGVGKTPDFAQGPEYIKHFLSLSAVSENFNQ